MKTLLLNTVIILFVLSSCSSHKSFTHQRYTSFGHKKHMVAADKKESYASTRKHADAVAEPVMVNTLPAAEPAVSAPARTDVITASAAEHATVLKRKPLSRLTEINFVATNLKAAKTHSAFKSFSKQAAAEKHHKRGLLFGVIDALLSIILIVLVVGIIVFLVLVLI